MNTRNTLLCISSYLDYQSLARLSQVNVLCYSVSNQDDLWRAETVRVCTTHIEAFMVLEEASPFEERRNSGEKPWRKLLVRTMETAILWSKLNVPFSGLAIDFSSIGRNVMDTLHSPDLPIPRLHREGSSFSTTTQELFADSLRDLDFPSFSEVGDALALLDPHADLLFQEVAGHVEEELLLKARWVLRDSPADFKRSNSILLRIYYCLKKSVQAHCKIVRAVLSETQTCGELLAKYCAHWAAFSAAAQELERDFRPVVELLNKAYEAKWPDTNAMPRFSVVKFMTLMWRRGVFDHLHTDVLHAAAVCLETVRTNPKSADKLQVLNQALVDLSIDEYSVHLLNHSQAMLDGPYNALQEIVMEQERKIAEGLTDMDECEEVAERELLLAERLYLPVTCRQISKLFAAKELLLLQTHFQSLALSTWSGGLSPTENSEAVNSAFGLFLYNTDLFSHQKPQVNHFINRLLAEFPHYKTKIDRFNELNEVCFANEKTMEDEWIERKAKRLIRVPVSVPPLLRSTAHDLKRTDLQDCSA